MNKLTFNQLKGKCLAITLYVGEVDRTRQETEKALQASIRGFVKETIRYQRFT